MHALFIVIVSMCSTAYETPLYKQLSDAGPKKPEISQYFCTFLILNSVGLT